MTASEVLRAYATFFDGPLFITKKGGAINDPFDPELGPHRYYGRLFAFGVSTGEERQQLDFILWREAASRPKAFLLSLKIGERVLVARRRPFVGELRWALSSGWITRLE